MVERAGRSTVDQTVGWKADWKADSVYCGWLSWTARKMSYRQSGWIRWWPSARLSSRPPTLLAGRYRLQFQGLPPPGGLYTGRSADSWVWNRLKG